MADDVRDVVPVEGAPVIPVGERAGILAFSSATPALRPRWFDGRLLAPEALAVEQRYRQVLVAACAAAGGAGVVFGLELSVEGTGGARRFAVQPGLAVTPDGRALFLTRRLAVPVADVLPSVAT